jgi:hypothetical protein
MLLALKLFAGNALGAVWRWIKAFFEALNWQGWIGLIAASVCALLWIVAASDARHWKKQSGQFERLYRADHATLQSISTKRNVQHDVTERTVEKVVKGDPVVQKIVQVIHDAPNPPDCKTPGIETLRNVL